MPHGCGSGAKWLRFSIDACDTDVEYTQAMPLRSGFVLAVASAFGALGASAAASATDLAYSPVAGASAEPLAPRWPTSVAELETFMDRTIAEQLKLAPAPGATVAVVKDGEIFFAKGYGYAAADNKIPVDPQRTLFRVGSISKLFAWTAVMQQVEQGRLDLDRDVNDYLKSFKIPATYPTPVTLRNLMTHSAGFEDGALGYLLVGSPQQFESVERWLPSHMPARVRPPTTNFASGKGVAYSNWGTVLAGYIAASAAGLPFDEYIERNIFEPLGMTRSSFREPLPAELGKDVAAGHLFAEERFQPQSFEFLHNEAPAGSLSSTARDMAKFAAAFLQGGAVGQGRILQAQTVQRMLTRSLSPNPALNGLALGFFDSRINGRRVVGHGGDTIYFHSMLTLLPEEGVALFVAFNSAESSEAGEQVERAFIDHYFPARVPEPTAIAGGDSERYVGRYRTLRQSATKIDKLLAAQFEFEVEAEEGGGLSFVHPLADEAHGAASRWVEVKKGLFRRADAAIFVAFETERDGTAFAVGPDASTAFVRIGWYERIGLHLLLLAAASALFISMAVSTVLQRKRDRAAAGGLRWARLLLTLAGMLMIGFLFLFFLAITAGNDELVLGFPSVKLLAALTLPLLAVPLTLAAVVFALLIWKQSVWPLPQKLHYTATVLGALAFLWVLHYWNLLGYRFG
jgi:CubicO group peptidase (beta-lactamase class C family)